MQGQVTTCCQLRMYFASFLYYLPSCLTVICSLVHMYWVYGLIISCIYKTCNISLSVISSDNLAFALVPKMAIQFM